MNSHESPGDELQAVWRQNLAGKEDLAMMIRLVQEKGKSFQDVVREQNRGEYLLALALGPLTALAAWKANTAIFQIGYLLLTVTLIAGCTVTWLYHRKERSLADAGSSVREYHRQLLDVYDRRIRFLKSVKFWYAIPLLSGASMVLFPLWTRNGNLWVLWMPVTLMVLVWVGMWHFNDVRRVGQVRRKRHEVEELLAQIEHE
jgi:hypothetical protein